MLSRTLELANGMSQTSNQFQRAWFRVPRARRSAMPERVRNDRHPARPPTKR